MNRTNYQYEESARGCGRINIEYFHGSALALPANLNKSGDSSETIFN